MTNAFTLFRSLVIYGFCLPLAIFLGYLLATPLDFSTFAFVGLVLLALSVPLLLRWHHPLLIASWNASLVVPFLPGSPQAWLVLAGLSLLVALLQRALNKKMRFLNVPSLTWPLILLAVVVLVTAHLTGGIGFSVLGGGAAGGKKYIYLLGPILGYFALTSHRIPTRRAALFVALFFLGAITTAVGNLAPLMPRELYFLFAFFPVEKAGLEAIGNEIVLAGAMARFYGLTAACLGVFCALLARHGIRGVFDLGRDWHFFPLRFQGGVGVTQPWRLIVFVGAVVISLFGGFRSFFIIMGLVFVLQFYFERLYRTRLLPIMIFLGILLLAGLVPVVDKLPLSVQRTLSILPVPVDPIAKYDAEGSSEWRVQMWRILVPEVRKYLILGKGYWLNAREIELLSDLTRVGRADSMEVALLAGDYHNGPLSVIIPFGIFGALGFLWFLIASLQGLLRNYRYGEAALRKCNTFLLAYFIGQTILFFAVFGGFSYSMLTFTGIIGLSVSLNGGIAKPASKSETAAGQLELAETKPRLSLKASS